jgi:hypothetical protein
MTCTKGRSPSLYRDFPASVLFVTGPKNYYSATFDVALCKAKIDDD